MKKNFTLTFAILLCLFCLSGHAQIQFWSDTFEDSGAPSSGARTPSIAEFSCGGPPLTAYFFRTTGTPAISLQNNGSANYGAIQGSKFWAMEDIDKGSTCTNNSISANQQITWSGINITGKSGLSFKGLFAADNIGAWQGVNWGAAEDFVAVEYRINGGAWVKAIAFYSAEPAVSAASRNTLDLDTNGDLIGDGASLNYTLTEYTALIVGTGTTLDLRLNTFANGSNSQEIAVDNFRLFETPPCTVSAATGGGQTNVSCFGGSNGSATVAPTGGTTPYTYSWAPSGGTAATATGLAAGTYTVTVTDNTGCTATRNYTITQPASALSTATGGGQTNVSCFGGTNGSATVAPTGGTSPYTYSWAPSGGTAATASGLASGSYTVTVTDNNGCTATRNYTITQPASALSTATGGGQTNVSCFGGTNGSATVAPTGGTSPYTYSWAPSGGTAATASGLASGTYTVTVTDNKGCTATRNYTITQPASALSTATGGGQTNVSCNGGTNGSATVAPTGGTAPYFYSWSPSGGTAATASGLTSGTYTVTVTDNNGCTATRNYTISQPAAINSSVSQAAGVLTANQSGATYQWYACPSTVLGGETGQSYTPSVVGDYKVDVSLAGCTVTSSCVTVNTLGTNSFDLFAKFKLYPNPNSGKLNIDSETDGDIIIVNQLGQIVQQFRVKANETTTVSIEKLAEGTYFVKGINGTNIATQKLVLKK